MTLNDRQKISAGIRMWVFLRPSWMSTNDTPEIVDR